MQSIRTRRLKGPFFPSPSWIFWSDLSYQKVGFYTKRSAMHKSSRGKTDEGAWGLREGLGYQDDKGYHADCRKIRLYRLCEQLITAHICVYCLAATLSGFRKSWWEQRRKEWLRGWSHRDETLQVPLLLKMPRKSMFLTAWSACGAGLHALLAIICN